MKKTALLFASLLIGSLVLFGCAEETQKSAQDEQAKIDAEKKASGDSETSY